MTRSHPGPSPAEQPARPRAELETALQQAEEKLKEAMATLSDAEAWFRNYEYQHMEKRTADGNAKAATNRRRADRIASTLSRLGAARSATDELS